MATTTKTRVVRVTGVPEELIRLLDNRVSERHYGGRSKYLRDLMRRDLLVNSAQTASMPEPHTPAELEAIFARIESRDRSHIQPLARGADSREAIYGEHG